MRLGIIGAGAAGICAAKHGLKFGHDVVVFEQTNQIGGTWIFTQETGKDKYGLDVHSSMYEKLHTNLPKELMCYPDFPYPEQEKSYIPHKDVYDYLNLYADTFNVRECVKFEHHVLRVRPLNDDTWEVIVKNLRADKYETYILDLILICNGHYQTTELPKYEGSELFKGRQMHSHDYRNAESFKDQSVLIIGAGPSGVDITKEVCHSAKRVTLSHHLNKEIKSNFLDNVDQKPDIQEITENGVIFNNGEKVKYSAIIFCTGYQYTFPFLSADCGVICVDNYMKPLYKHCLNINRPTMGIIGLPYYVCTVPMFDLQVRFCLKFMTGLKELPSKEEMMEETDREMEQRWERGLKKCQAHLMGTDVHEVYYNDVAATADIEPLKPVLSKMFNKSLCSLIHDLTNYRKDIFKVLDDDNFILIKG
ncbi:unnamed protein product [Diamesa hyperborea]